MIPGMETKKGGREGGGVAGISVVSSFNLHFLCKPRNYAIAVDYWQAKKMEAKIASHL